MSKLFYPLDFARTARREFRRQIRHRRYKKLPSSGPHHRIVSISSPSGVLRLVSASNDSRSWILSEQRQVGKIAVFRQQIAQLEVDALLDIGANYGEFSFAVANDGVRVLAIEPNPVVAECLRQSCLLNTSDHGVAVFEGAISTSGEDTSLMSLSFENSGSGIAETRMSLLTQILREHNFLIRVPCISIVEALEKLKSSLGPIRGLAVKIDIEGGEAAVLSSILKMLKLDPDFALIKLIMFEFNKRSSSDVAQISLNLGEMIQLGYDVLYLPDRSDTPISVDIRSADDLKIGEIIVRKRTD